MHLVCCRNKINFITMFSNKTPQINCKKLRTTLEQLRLKLCQTLRTSLGQNLLVLIKKIVLYVIYT